ncbi:glycosyltransferase [Microbacterium sp. 179-B 1A2 NHS]|uniref:glycosyltransferase n=1 Tax=Microbacterium sp. 179-B 1A2 NHS TaxID=3142383 RepID=UPI0039A1A2DA
MGARTTSRPAGTVTRPAHIRVLAVPAAHPYIERISAAAGVTVLPDVPVAGADAGVWWPPAALDPAWIASHRDDADLLHVHFGTESFPAGHLTACIEAAHTAGWPVVYTLHDLEHPQLGDNTAYERQLDELVSGADAVVTLTPGAAAEISKRWGRDALVVPHPSILADAASLAPPSADGTRRIGVHLKDLRPNVDGPGTVRALIGAVHALRETGVDVHGEVRLHRRVRDERARDEVRRLAQGTAHLTLREDDRLSDDELTAALSALDACVLPYRHGTHSGWLELCWDLGVPVAAPALGFYRQQHADGSVASFAPADAASLAAAVRELWQADATRPGSTERAALVTRRRGERVRTDAAAAAQHADLYAELVAGGDR